MLGAGYLQLTSSLARRSASVVDQQLSFYLAEAGLAESFQAVRMGRTGQVGSDAAPARFGDGLVWVDVLEQADGSLRLDSTGLCGTGRKTLSLVVEPVDLALGFFADEDLVLDSVLMVDGFDSENGGYMPTLRTEPEPLIEPLPPPPGTGKLTIDPAYPYLHDDPARQILFYEGTFYRYVTKSENDLSYDLAVDYQVIANDPTYDAWGCDPHDFTQPDDWMNDYDAGHEYDGVLAYFDALEGGALDAAPLAPIAPVDGVLVEDGAEEPAAIPLGPTTGGGGRLGSNGDIRFELPPDRTAEIWGDLQPGPGGAVFGLDQVSVSGDTQPRSMTVELPEVQVPVVALAAPVVHDGLLPLLIASGTSGHQRIQVAVGAELVIRGPATVVIGELVLEPGASLSLDTRNGDVALYITQSIDLQPGSNVSTSGDAPDETSLQVAAVPSSPGDPAVKLDATAAFYGTVYAPDAEVRVGSAFEVFGGIVARRLEIEPGARLHFDSAGFEGSALPRILGWRVIEVPASVKSLRGDPFVALGLDPAALRPISGAHDLGAVDMDLEYIDLAGVLRQYTGKEDLFDWSGVVEVVSVERVATRTKAADDSSADVPPEDPPPAEPDPTPTGGVRVEVADAIASLSGPAIWTALMPLTPLTEAEASALIESQKTSGLDSKELLLASSPLGDAPLRLILNDTSGMTSRQAKEVLLASSPLSPDALALVTSNPDGVLSPADQTAVLDANR